MKDKMKNIHVLPTDKPSRLYQLKNDILRLDYKIDRGEANKHIYITSDEEIKVGDWYFSIDKFIRKANIIWDNLYGENPNKKIILTTDQDLIKDGVQDINDEFLEWFVENPNCEEIGVKKYENNKYWTYEKIIPKEEPKKVLTEEDIFNQKDIDAVTDYINKEQQKQHLIDMMESDEELGLYDETIDSIKLEEVFGSKHCLYSVIENKLAILYRNQEKILSAIKILNNGRK